MNTFIEDRLARSLARSSDHPSGMKWYRLVVEVIFARKFEQTLKSSKILIDEEYFEYAMAA
jgi:hypothetical protein